MLQTDDFFKEEHRKTYSQRGAAADAVLTTQPLAFLIRSTIGHERPLDHTLRSLGERKSPRHLAHAHVHTHTKPHTELQNRNGMN